MTAALNIKRPDYVKAVKSIPTVQSDAAREFLNFLDADAEDFATPFAFQTYDDDKERKGPARTLVGTLDAHLASLTTANRDRYAVHVNINDTGGKRRGATNVVRVRKHFVEIDGTKKLNAILKLGKAAGLTVARVNELSPGKFHVYWNVADDVQSDLTGFTRRQKQLAKLFSGGRESVDLSRVLRLPGFYHQKGKPWLVRCTYTDPAAPSYGIADFERALAGIEIDETPDVDLTVEHGEDQTAIDGATEMLKTWPRAITNTDTPDGTKHKKGNSTTYDAAAECKDLGLDEATTLDVMDKIYNATRCDPPWPFEKLQEIVRNAYRYTQNAQGAKHPDVVAAKDFAADPIDDAALNAYIEADDFRLFKLARAKANANGTASSKPGIGHNSGRLEIVDMETVKPEAINYIWPNRIARGKHSTIAGVGGKGKSQVLYYTAAQISLPKGGEWPMHEGRAPHGSVLILSAEDDIIDMMQPRLVTAGADLKYVKAIRAVVKQDGKKKRFSLLDDLDALRAECRARGDVVLIGIDPLGSYLGGELDTHRDAALRSALDPISELAADVRCGIFSVMHFNKAATMKAAMDRVMGGAGFVNAPRCAMGFLVDDDDADKRDFVCLKTNMDPPQGLQAHIETADAGRAASTGRVIKAPHIVWDSVIEKTADMIVAASREREAPKLDDAIAFLQAELKDGPRPVEAVKSHATALSISAITLKRAREEIGVTARQIEGVPHGGWEYFPFVPGDDDFGQ